MSKIQHHFPTPPLKEKEESLALKLKGAQGSDAMNHEKPQGPALTRSLASSSRLRGAVAGGASPWRAQS